MRAFVFLICISSYCPNVFSVNAVTMRIHSIRTEHEYNRLNLYFVVPPSKLYV